MSGFRTLLPFIRPFRGRLLLGIAGSCLVTMLGVIPPLLIRALVDRVIEPRAWGLLPVVAGSLLLAYLLASAARFANSMTIIGTTQRFIAMLRRDMYAHILSLGIGYQGEKSGGMLVNRLMADVSQIDRLVSVETLQLLADVVTFIFSLVVAFAISARLAAILCIILALDIIVTRHYTRRIRQSGEAYRSKMDEISGRLQEILAGARQVRIYNRETWETANFLDRTTQSLKRSLSTSISSLNLGAACSSISGFGSTVIVGLGASMVLKGEISNGDLIAFNTYAWMAITPAISLSTMAGQLAEILVSARRVAEVLDEKPVVQSFPGAPRIRRGRGAVEFRDITFSYSEQTPLFRGLNLEIEPGTTVALVGATGCGKTTLTSLLMRHRDVQDGVILLDGVDIRTVDLDSLRGLFGVVLQQPAVFEGSLADNIAYGKPRATPGEIRAAARAAELEDLVLSLPNGFGTMLGSKGVSLSVGEKQRVSIARAILKDPLILVMDEATSSLDSESETLIQKALSKVMKGRTCLVIAHRLSTITGADKIVAMSSGRIVETGTHRELLAIENGLYRKFYEELQGHKEQEER